MPVDSTAARNAFLLNSLGPNRGPATPATLEVAMFMGDPNLDGVEVTTAGAARVTWDSDDWEVASDEEIQTTADVVFPDPTDEYPDTVTHWAAFKTGETDHWLSNVLSEGIDVTSAGDGVAIRPTLPFDDDE